ncbi:GntR family transcriptional regulator [Phyllobacterium phragmitis]|uniref:GntR family transcriptional regulator n=1 Tax=Phyllobacterium phragmitis TaxID=2670329 RepID=A0A2S9IWB3_9HYPH|nr:FadR/GntR family transcriptional regulator [Phyllobacterium phragmitis]PRD44813.1 GntR family transcriptional regulator [Phyllobacterium phragmitis]
MTILKLPGGGRRYLEIAQNLSDSITAGTYKTGDRLPPERELAATLQVSRTTVREALLALEIMRFVEIRIGSGVFVLPENLREKSRGELLPVEEVGPWEVLEARRMVEGESAFRAAQRATEAQIAALADCIERMEARIDDVPRFDQADAEFHMLIASAAGNSLIENYVAHLWRLRESALWDRWYDATRHPANRRRSVEDHKAIYKAIKRELPEVAKTAMCAHIDVLAERFFDLNL